MSRAIEAAARRIWERVFPLCRSEVLPGAINPDWRSHAPPTDKRGLEGIRTTLMRLREAFDVLRYEMLYVCGDGDRVAVYCRATARHTGPRRILAATGRRFSSGQARVLRFRNGRAVEHRVARVDLGKLRNLDVLGGPSRWTPNAQDGR